MIPAWPILISGLFLLYNSSRGLVIERIVVADLDLDHALYGSDS